MLVKYIEQEINDTVICLPASKSISNRALIIQALATSSIKLENISDAEDVQVMLAALRDKSFKKNVGISGTVARFLSAFLATRKESYIIDADKRMQERPMKDLLLALEQLGVEIDYLKNRYHLPIRIDGVNIHGGEVKLSAKVSSQFVSALMMIAPCLKGGLAIEMQDKISSKTYIDMTAKIMAHFKIKIEMKDANITIPQQEYAANTLFIENDWSSASYVYSALALVDEGSILLKNMTFDSWQGDSILAEIYYRLGIISSKNGEDLLLEKSENVIDFLEYDFSDCPDLAQSVICTCIGLGVEGSFWGMHTLMEKETNRIQALQNELLKFNWQLLDEGDGTYSLTRSKIPYQNEIKVITYNDHRMAMAFAPLSIIYGEIEIENPQVVKKSFPNFWTEMKKIGIA